MVLEFKGRPLIALTSPMAGVVPAANDPFNASPIRRLSVVYFMVVGLGLKLSSETCLEFAISKP